MNWIKSNKRLTCFILAVIAGLFFLVIPKCSEVPVVEYNKPLPLPKVIEVKKPYVPPVVVPNVPVKKKIAYKGKNKPLRDSVEKKDIIIDVKISDNHVIETVIDTAGKVSELTLDVPVKLEDGVKEVVIVPEGVQKKDRKKFRAWCDRAVKNGKTVLIVIGGITVIVVVAVLAGG